MKKLGLVLGLGLFMFSCVSYKYGTTIKMTSKKNAAAYIEYKSNKALINDNSKSKPKGGYIYIHVAGYTIDAGNTEYWTCIVSDKNGKEISRKTGDYNIPNIPTHIEGDPSGNLWTNLMLMRLDSNITDTFNVRIVNDLSSVSNNYMVFPNQKVK